MRSARDAKVLSSKVSYQGPLFRVLTEEVSEPDGKQTTRDIIRHNGSIVILAVDTSKGRKDPRVIMEQQYRHAAGQYLIELPAGKLEPGEDSLEGAKRELIEETGYRAKHWTKLVRYYASPGFLGEVECRSISRKALPVARQSRKTMRALMLPRRPDVENPEADRKGQDPGRQDPGVAHAL